MQNKTPSPMAEVKARFETREALIDQLIPLLGDKDPGLKASLTRASNAKLLQLHKTGKLVERRFGGRKQLVEAVTQLTYPSGKAPAEYADTLASYNLKRLYDLHQKRS
jgi:hypothetical protein